MPEIRLKSFLCVRSKAEGPYVEYLGIIEGVGMRLDITDKGQDKILRLAAPGPDKYPVALMNVAEDTVL
jgi:hypothetical protein